MTDFDPQQPWGQQPPQYPSQFGMDPTPTGPPWEDDSQSFPKGWWQTFKQCATQPGSFFASMRPEGDFLKPMLYSAIGGLFHGLGKVLLGVISIPLSLGSSSLPSQNAGAFAAGQLTGAMCASLCNLLIYPVFWLVAVFAMAGVVHLLLMLFGGAQRGYETTYRVLAYCIGTTNICALFPCGGVFISMIWMAVIGVVGVQKAHGTELWRSAAAVLIPFMFCCLSLGGLVIVYGAALMAILVSMAGMPGGPSGGGF